jgi:hypothetical protein
MPLRVLVAEHIANIKQEACHHYRMGKADNFGDFES